MQEPPPEEPPRSTEGRLDSWKKIAVYLKRDVTTVQRWEKREGMPVHRQLHDKMGSVYAFRTELDAWMHRRSEQPAAQTPSAARRRTTVTAGAALIAAMGFAALVWFERSDHFWHNPIAGATFQPVTGFDGENEAAAVSRDGQFVAFLSDRGGRTDVWVTQVGSGQFHNLTKDTAGELVNPSIRTLGFSPDGTLVTFWLRAPSRAHGEDISIWAVPTLGGEPRPYLEGAAEIAWSPDGHQIVYHTTQPGDPLFVTDGKDLSRHRTVLSGPPGLHNHFPLWSAGNLIYFVKGTLPDQLDVWRVGIRDGAPERITAQNARITYPILLGQRSLLYLANAPDGSGPWIYGMDVERRVPHRLTAGVEQYTSLAASADGRRVIATASEPERTLWRMPIGDQAGESAPVHISLATGTGSAPRLGPDYLLYIAAAGTGESIWKISASTAMQLWAGNDARIIGGPAVSTDGRAIAFTVKQGERTRLYSMAADGTRLNIVTDSLALRGAPAWAPDGRSLISAAQDGGLAHLYRIPLAGGAPTVLVQGYSVDPAFAPDGRFVVYSGPDVGTQFRVSAASAANGAYPLPPLTLTRGARHLVLLPGGERLIFLQGELQHKNLWMVDLKSGALQQLTHMPADFDVRDFDISADGHEAILERAQARSHVVAIDRTAF